MEVSNQPPVIYKREKGKVEISGEADKVKKHIWFEQINTTLFWLVPVIILLCAFPKASWLPVILDWIKKLIPVLVFWMPVQMLAALSLSG
jgi:hypothetical protein